MRSFILGIVILVAVPAYAVGQQRDRSERSATGRTAVPREKDVQAAPAGQTDRRAESRGERRRTSPREEESDDVAPARGSRERRNTPGAVQAERGRLRDVPLQPAAAATQRTGLPRLARSPASIAWPNYVPPVRAREFWYRRPRGGANLVYVPYAVPVVVEREVVIEREVVDEGPAAPVILEEPSPARLILDVHPPTAQIFADGYYIGLPEDFRFEDGGAVLEPGPHRIDILDRDYEPVSFDVNLARGQSATFRHMLKPIWRGPQPAPDAAAKASPVAKPPSTFYLIPGCYMGNVPPKEANLPATCDIARALSFQY